MKNVTKGMIIAAAAASLLATASFAVSGGGTKATQESVMCVGANTCRGMSECKMTTHSCKGMNSCKGKGWIKMANAYECQQRGGVVSPQGSKN